jgi:hypothetical protein
LKSDQAQHGGISGKDRKKIQREFIQKNHHKAENVSGFFFPLIIIWLFIQYIIPSRAVFSVFAKRDLHIKIECILFLQVPHCRRRRRHRRQNKRIENK